MRQFLSSKVGILSEPRAFPPFVSQMLVHNQASKNEGAVDEVGLARIVQLREGVGTPKFHKTTHTTHKSSTEKMQRPGDST